MRRSPNAGYLSRPGRRRCPVQARYEMPLRAPVSLRDWPPRFGDVSSASRRQDRRRELPVPLPSLERSWRGRLSHQALERRVPAWRWLPANLGRRCPFEACRGTGKTGLLSFIVWCQYWGRRSWLASLQEWICGYPTAARVVLMKPSFLFGDGGLRRVHYASIVVGASALVAFRLVWLRMILWTLIAVRSSRLFVSTR